MTQANISIRLNSELKQNFDNLCNELGFSVNDMIEACSDFKIVSKEFIKRVKDREKDKRENPQLYNSKGKRSFT